MSGRRPDPALVAFVAEELARPTLPEAEAFASDLAGRGGVAAVLFYGSCLQRKTTEGMLDFYVLADGPRAYGQNALIALLGRALPPNVYPETFSGLRAKAAVTTPAAFRRRMGPAGLDTTFWARFCQRAALVWARDEAARRDVAEAVAAAVETAAIWAQRLGDGAEGAEAFRRLFARTYRIEIRVEPPERAAAIVDAEPERYETLWRLTAAARAADDPAGALAGWRLRWLVGKALHVARLLKALATFRGGPSYLLWKIRRHRARRG